MKYIRSSFDGARVFLIASVMAAAGMSAIGQVSPTEVSNPRAKGDEQKYLPQLVALQKSIGAANFPYTFRLARYLNAKPGQGAALDSNGLEFVYFQEKVVLKVSGFYRVAFNSIGVTRNGRASQTMQDAVLPILRMLAEQMPQTYDYDAIGFEILYDARDSSGGYDYEGREVLTAVFGRDDAFALARSTSDEEQQQILSRSDVFVNGKELELAWIGRDPTNEAPQRPAAPPPIERASFTPLRIAHPAIAAAPESVSSFGDSSAADMDAARVGRKLQAEVNAIREGQDAPARAGDQAIPPSLEIRADRRMLHYAMQNTLSFQPGQTSIYKRAAQSFDLFLAPELNDILKHVPADAAIDALHFSILNRVGAEKSETIEYICPMDTMRSFADGKITTQDLINKSTVLVNGVRIGLDLQLVE